MTETRPDHVEVRYQAHDYWRGEKHARNARIDEVEVTRKVTRYPVTKSGNIQWSRGTDETTPLFRVPVDELGSLVKELFNVVTYHASGQVLDDLSFNPAQAKDS